MQSCLKVPLEGLQNWVFIQLIDAPHIFKNVKVLQLIERCLVIGTGEYVRQLRFCNWLTTLYLWQAVSSMPLFVPSVYHPIIFSWLATYNVNTNKQKAPLNFHEPLRAKLPIETIHFEFVEQKKSIVFIFSQYLMQKYTERYILK